MMAGARSTVMRVGRMNTMRGTVMSAGMRAPFSSALEARVWRNSWLRIRSELASGVLFFCLAERVHQGCDGR